MESTLEGLVVGNPLHEVSRVFVLDILHLLLNFLHQDLTMEDSSNLAIWETGIRLGKEIRSEEKVTHGEITPMPGIQGCHHVLGIKHLLGELGDSHSMVLLASARGQRCETGHKV